jgi:Domain of unknown function (DUF4926)
MIKEHDIVVLACDLPERGLKKGQIGAVVMIHDSAGYEVEFVGSDGKTITVVPLSAELVLPASPEEQSSLSVSAVNLGPGFGLLRPK